MLDAGKVPRKFGRAAHGKVPRKFWRREGTKEILDPPWKITCNPNVSSYVGRFRNVLGHGIGNVVIRGFETHQINLQDNTSTGYLRGCEGGISVYAGKDCADPTWEGITHYRVFSNEVYGNAGRRITVGKSSSCDPAVYDPTDIYDLKLFNKVWNGAPFLRRHHETMPAMTNNACVSSGEVSSDCRRLPNGLRGSGLLSSFSLAALLLAALLLLGPPSVAQDGTSFDDSTTVVVVEVPVNVHVEGKAVRGLTRDDFEIREGGRNRPLVGFEVVDLAVDGGVADRSAARVPIAARRHFLLFFDLTAGGLVGLEGALDLVDSGLHPQDLVGVGVYGRAGAGLLLGFTADHDQVRRVLHRLGDGEAVVNETSGASRRDPLRLMPDTRAIDIARDALEMDTGGRGSQAEVYFEMNRANVAQGRARARAEVVRFSDALGRLADATARIDGRKFLVFFSAGFDDDVFFEEENLTRRSLLDSRQGSTALRDLQRMTERFRKAGWSIQSVDAAGLQEGRNLSGGTSLALLANETGGETYRSFNDLGGAMLQMLDKTSVTYLLAFQADDVPIDGAFRKIKIHLREGPRGARLIHRPGYYAPKPYDPEAEETGLGATADRFSTAEMLLSGEIGGSLEVAVLPSTFRRGAASRTSVWLDIRGLDGVSDQEPFTLEVFAYVMDGNQGVADFVTRSLTLDPAKIGERLEAGGLRLQADFDLEPGAYDLRLLVREPTSGLYVLARQSLEIPALDDRPSLLPPFLVDDAPAGLVVRPNPGSDADGDALGDYPFVAGEAQAFVPAVDPTLGPGATMRVCLMGYHLTREGLVLRAELFDVTDGGDGERVDGDRVVLVGRSETAADGLDRLYLTLSTAGLAEGSYELRASIEGAAAGLSQVTSAPFRVGS